MLQTVPALVRIRRPKATTRSYSNITFLLKTTKLFPHPCLILWLVLLIKAVQPISRKVRSFHALKQEEIRKREEEEICSPEQEIAEHEEKMRRKNRNLQRRGTSLCCCC